MVGGCGGGHEQRGRDGEAGEGVLTISELSAKGEGTTRSVMIPSTAQNNEIVYTCYSLHTKTPTSINNTSYFLQL